MSRGGLGHFQSGCFADLGAELLAKTIHVVGEDRRFAAGARDGHVSESGAEQVGMDAGIGVNENALGGESLGAMTGDRVAVVEMPMLANIEFDLPVIVKTNADAAISRNGLDHGKIAVGDTDLLVGSGELDAVADRELVRDFAVDADTGKAARIVGDELASVLLDRQQVL